MKIAMDARYLAADALRGMDRYVIGLTNSLKELGCEVVWLARSKERIKAKHISSCDVEVQYLADMGVIYWEQISVPRALFRSSFDLYHATSERGVPRFSPRPVLYTWHSATHLSYSHMVERGILPGRLEDYVEVKRNTLWGKFYSWYFSSQAGWATKVATVSRFSRDEIVNLARQPADKVVLTPLAISADFRNKDVCLSRAEDALLLRGVQPPYLLFVGGFEKHKNIKGLLNAFRLVLNRFPALKLLLIGTGVVPREIEEYASLIGVAAGTVFLSNVSEELIDFYDNAAAFVSLSWRESFGLPYLEAMSRGCPVVCSKYGASVDVVGSLGWLVDPSDPEAVAAAIEEAMISDKSAIGPKLVKAAHAFSWENCGALTLDAYRAMLRS